MRSERLGQALHLALLAAGFLACTVGNTADLTFPGGTVTFAPAKGGQALAAPVKIILFLTALSVLPALLIAATAFTRIIVVLAILRQAIGMTTTPPNAVLISLALFLTLFTMTPVLQRIDAAAIQPYLAEKITEQQAAELGLDPLKRFLVAQTRDKDIGLIMELAHQKLPDSVSEIGIFQLIPAFMLSELRTAFEIGFVIYLPFILIDMIVASVLMSLGMIMVPPLAMSLPLKILMFVLIDGWSLVTEALVRSFQP